MAYCGAKLRLRYRLLRCCLLFQSQQLALHYVCVIAMGAAKYSYVGAKDLTNLGMVSQYGEDACISSIVSSRCLSVPTDAEVEIAYLLTAVAQHNAVDRLVVSVRYQLFFQNANLPERFLGGL